MKVSQGNGGNEIRARHNRDKYGGGLTEFAPRDLICIRLRNYEPKEMLVF